MQLSEPHNSDSSKLESVETKINFVIVPDVVPLSLINNNLLILHKIILKIKF